MVYTKNFVVALLFWSFWTTENIYTFSVDAIDGRIIQLQNYKGKKMLFLVIPFSGTDTTISAGEIAALQTMHPDVTVFAVPPEDLGYVDEDQPKLKSLFRSFSSNFILTESMNVKKASGAKQSPILQWLTDKNKNRHFDNDVRGIGQKFFVDERGELYAVIGPEIKLSNPMIEQIASRRPGN